MGQTDDSQTPLDRVLHPAGRGLPCLLRVLPGAAMTADRASKLIHAALKPVVWGVCIAGILVCAAVLCTVAADLLW